MSRTPVPFHWSSACEWKAKILLVSALLLHPPSMSLQLYLCTDTSTLGFGAVLKQLGEDGCSAFLPHMKSEVKVSWLNGI